MLGVTMSAFQAGDLPKSCELRLRTISISLTTWERIFESRDPPSARRAWRNLTEACYDEDATARPVVPLDTVRRGR